MNVTKFPSRFVYAICNYTYNEFVVMYTMNFAKNEKKIKSTCFGFQTSTQKNFVLKGYHKEKIFLVQIDIYK